MAEVKIAADARETEKCMEKRHVFANKLYMAELNRERELQKKLDAIRKHVRTKNTLWINSKPYSWYILYYVI